MTHQDGHLPIERARLAVEGGSAVSDAALQRGYAGVAHVTPSVPIRIVLRALGPSLALRLPPRLVLAIPALTAAGGGPGWVRVRCAGATSDRRRCLERQGTILARAAGLGLAPCILEDVACVSRGDASCEYVLHCRSPSRWDLVVLAAGAAVAIGWAAGAPTVAVVLLGALAGATGFLAQRWSSGRADSETRDASSRAFRSLVDGARAVEQSSLPADAMLELQEPAVSGMTSSAAGRAAEHPLLEQEGDVWRITYDGTTIGVRHSRGVALLSHLLRHPGEELQVQMLDALVPSAGAGAERLPVNPDSLPIDGMSYGLGDAGPVIDDRARADYRRRLADLRAELEDAERCNDPGRAAVARREIEQLGDELRAATGLGGRTRRASSDADRMRLAVTRRIRAAIEQIGKLHPALGEHLERNVRTGFTCCYAPVEHSEHSRRSS